MMHSRKRPSLTTAVSQSLVRCVALMAMWGCGAQDSPASAKTIPLTDGGVDATVSGACFQRHLEEAIELNEARRPQYAALTGGRSEPISDTLVESEKTSLLFAKQVDEAAVPFQEAGVAIVCEEFVPMSGTPSFADRFAFEPEPVEAFEPVDGAQLRQDLEAAFAEGGFAALSMASDAWLHANETPRAYHCMLRHMLESLRRVANLAPVHEARTVQLGMSSSLPLSEEMVRLHFLSLGAAAALDEKAAPLQSEGIPILCQDVPPIPPGP